MGVNVGWVGLATLKLSVIYPMVTRRNSESLGGAEVRAAPASSNFGNGFGEGAHSLLRESGNEFEIPGMCSSRPILKLPAASSSNMFATRSLIATSLDRPLCSVLCATILSDLISPLCLLESSNSSSSELLIWPKFPKWKCGRRFAISCTAGVCEQIDDDSFYDPDAPDTHGVASTAI